MLIEREELDLIKSTLEVEVSDDPMQLKERLAQVATFHSRLSFLIIEAKKNLRERKSGQIKETIVEIAKEGGLSAKVQNSLLDSICNEEQYEVDTYERLQSSCVHDIDVCRSILSYRKEELNKLNI